ncbi:response regulator transcription factor [Paenibacillus planticolens]|uniref:Response regulator n=1 Tax=Paenibacillus planticolens TaxID=2654976 RepID=A0ABX1ZYS2_9BACL|nr:response regulator [Paenibacillus planticolens]NOV03918.1 response regulator [Paenibacillus planticolens]
MYNLLIVDDEPRHRDGLAKLIGKLRPEYHVFKAKNGHDALAIMADNTVDIVFSDIHMPQMNGLQLMEHFDNTDNPPKLVILSGYKQFEYAQAALRLGVCEYLLKPIDVKTINHTLDKIEQSIFKSKTHVIEAENRSAKQNDTHPMEVNQDNHDGEKERAIQKCLQYIEQNYAEDLFLESVARHFSFNTSYFSHYFKVNTGTSFTQYLLQTRLGNGKALLEETTLKIYEISKLIGFKETRYFNRVFKKEFGVTPLNYRRVFMIDSNMNMKP